MGSGKVSNIEHGKVRATEIDIIQYLGRYRSAFDHYFVQVPTNLRTVTMAESSADKITTYNLTAIPGLVQAEEYATAYFEVGGWSVRRTSRRLFGSKSAVTRSWRTS